MDKADIILITGAGGFIGFNLAKKLCEEGYNVHGIVRDMDNALRFKSFPLQMILHQADLRNPVLVEKIFSEVNPDIVFNMAEPGGHPKDLFDFQERLSDSLQALINIISALRKTKCKKIIHAGSSTEQGTYPVSRVGEKTSMYRSLRGIIKMLQSNIWDYIAKDSDLCVINAQIFSVYGDWEQSNRLTPTLIRSLYNQIPIQLTPYPVYRDFIYVEDVVNTLIQLAVQNFPSGTNHHVGSGKLHTNYEVLELLETITGKSAIHSTQYHKIKDIDTDYPVANPDQFSTLLDIKKLHTLSEGLQATVKWYLSHGKFWE